MVVNHKFKVGDEVHTFIENKPKVGLVTNIDILVNEFETQENIKIKYESYCANVVTNISIDTRSVFNTFDEMIEYNVNRVENKGQQYKIENTYNTKFSCGDEVYCVHENKIIKAGIEEISINSSKHDITLQDEVYVLRDVDGCYTANHLFCCIDYLTTSLKNQNTLNEL